MSEKGAFLKIAWRDLWRQRLRSVLTLSVIVFGTAMTLFVMAFQHGQHSQMLRTAIEIFPGYIQVHSSGYQMDQGIGRSMDVKEELMNYLERSRLVNGYSPRLCTDALVQAGSNISGARICGVTREKEIKVSRIAKTFYPELIKTPKGVKVSRRFSGGFLSGKESKEAVLGEDLAKKLQVSAGDEISILTQDFYGSIASCNFQVKGIFKAGSPEYDSGLMLVNLSELQSLLYMPGRITQLVVNVKDTNRVSGLEKAIYRILSNENGPWRIDNISKGVWQINPMKPSLAPGSPLQLAEEAILEKALKRIPEIKAYSFQLKSSLMLGDIKISSLGIEPEREKFFNQIFRVDEEDGLFQGDDWIVLRSDIALKEGLKPGDRLVLKGENYLGERFELNLKLVETFVKDKSSPDAYLPLTLLQDNLRLGSYVHQAMIKLPSRMTPEQAKGLICSRLNYEVIPWQELIPDMIQLATLDTAGSVLWMLMLLVVIGFVVLLTILMSILEKSHQFGVMKAIGTKPIEIFQIIFYESIFLSLLGVGIGLVLGAIPSLYFTFIPLKLGSLSEYMEEFGFEPFLYAKLEPAMFFYTAIIIFTMVLLMTIFPALRASRIKAVQTLRLQ